MGDVPRGQYPPSRGAGRLKSHSHQRSCSRSQTVFDTSAENPNNSLGREAPLRRPGESPFRGRMFCSLDTTEGRNEFGGRRTWEAETGEHRVGESGMKMAKLERGAAELLSSKT